MKLILSLLTLSSLVFAQVAEPSGGGYATNTYQKEADELIVALEYVKTYGDKLFSDRNVKIENIGIEGYAVVVKALRYNAQDRLESRVIYLEKEDRPQVGYDISGFSAYKISYDSKWK